jgi:hypothetical protein
VSSLADRFSLPKSKFLLAVVYLGKRSVSLEDDAYLSKLYDVCMIPQRPIQASTESSLRLEIMMPRLV